MAGILHDVLEDLEPTDSATRNRFREVFPDLSEAPARLAEELDAAVNRLAGVLDLPRP